MKRQFLQKYWYVYVLGALLLLQAGVLLSFGEDCFLAIHDNLDLFVAHNKMMKNQGIFFAQDAQALMLGSVSRDNLGSELSVYNMLSFLFPSFVAYIIVYFAKIAVGFSSCLLLAKDIYGEKYKEYRPFLWIVAAGFSVIPVFPAYGMAFTSVPLLVYLLRRIYREPKIWMYACVFVYPLISYFSYFGFFLLAYLVCGVVILWIRDKKFPVSLCISVPVLALGYVVCEYRLFREMLFGSTVTIRESMVQEILPLGKSFAPLGMCL